MVRTDIADLSEARAARRNGVAGLSPRPTGPIGFGGEAPVDATQLRRLYPDWARPGLIPAKGKRPSERGWNDKALARYESERLDKRLPQLAAHVEGGGSLGWMPPPGVVVLDCDSDASVEGVANLVREAGVKPPRQKTGRGEHLVFRVPDGVEVRGTTGVDLGGFKVDFRVGRKNFIVVAPSLHVKTGNPYRWHRRLPREATSLPYLPDSIVERLRAASAPASKNAERCDPGERIPEGDRNDTLMTFAGSLRTLGLDEGAIAERLLAANAQKCDPPLSEKEVRSIAASVARYAAGGDPLSDMGNAARFVRAHGDSLRHCEVLGNNAWLRWDGTIWRRGLRAAAQELAKATVREMAIEAACIADENAQSALGKWARTSQSRSKLAAMMDVASSELEVAPTDLDADWNLLVTPRESLVFGESDVTVREHRREDFATRTTAVPFDPEARCRVWEQLLERALPDPDLRAYFQRGAGYTLVGGQQSKCFFILYGPPDTAKTTVLNTLARALGDYTETTRLATFGIDADRGGNTPSLSRLHGPRMIMVPDIPPMKDLGVGLLKQWTGSDPVEACAKYAHPFTFRPAGKLWFIGNHRPRIPYDDEASWRRLKVLPFEVTIPKAEQDPRIGDRVDLGAVLAWAVDGWRQYRKAGGLAAPEKIRAAVAEYREENDPLSEFLEEATVPGGEVSKKELYEAYQIDCSVRSIRRPLGKRSFGNVLRAREGIEEVKSGDHRWRGISLRQRRVEKF